jgi:regulatory protein
LHANASQYALKLLSYRGRSEKELRERLTKKGFKESITSGVIDHLKALRLIDDEALAEILKREAIQTKLLSQYGAKRYLRQKGISHEIIDSVFSDHDNSDIENAQRFTEKKLRSLKRYPQNTIRRRIYTMLSRRGYSSGTIMTVLKNLNLRQEV